MRFFSSLMVLGAALVLSACSTQRVEPPKETRVHYTFEEFIAMPTYRLSRDFWCSKALDSEYTTARVEILLHEQRGRLYLDNQIAMDFPVSTGKDGGYATPVGQFRITQKKEDHRSSIYGSFVDGEGNVVKSGIRSSDKRPAGTHYVGVKLPYWMRFSGAIGMHEGLVYREPVSHGCVRIPHEIVPILYEKLSVGSPVLIRQRDGSVTLHPV